MATQQLDLPGSAPDDAAFRTWGKGISDAIAACGLTKVSTTINWTTATRPGAFTYAGYEIWAFADDLQATMPAFLKLEYGNGPNANDRLALAATLTTAVSGGTPTGKTTVRAEMFAPTRNAGVLVPTYICGDDAGLALIHGLEAAVPGSATGLVVGRTQDANGNTTPDGIYLYAWQTTNQPNFQLIPRAGAAPEATLSGLPVPHTRGAQTSVGGDVTLLVPVLMVGKVFYTDRIFAYEHANIGRLGLINAPLLGSTKTLLPLGDSAGSSSHGVGAQVVVGIKWQ